MAGYDVLTYFYPNEQYAADSLRNGTLPLWNPYLFTGVPFLANVQTALFYPPNLLFLVLPVPHAYALSIVLHAFLAAAFAYAFGVSALRLARTPAFVLAVVYAFGGFFGALTGHLNQLQASAWLPLLLLLAATIYRGRSVRLAGLGSLAVGAQFLAGHMQEFYISMVALALFVAWLVIEDLRERPQLLTLLTSLLALLPLGLMLGLGLAIAAAQFLPTFELTRESIRAGGMTFKEATAFSLPPWELLRALFPAHGDPRPFSEWVGYTGVAALALAAFAFIRRPRHRAAFFFLALAAIALFLALGQYNPLYPIAHRVLPGLSMFRVPARWLLLFSFALASLAGFGTQALAGYRGDGWPTKGRALGVCVGSVTFLAALLLVLAVTLDPTSTRELPGRGTTLLWIAAMLLAVAAITVGLWRFGRLGRGLVALLVAGELLVAGQGLELNRVTVPEAFASLRPAVSHLLSREGLFRVLPFSEGNFDPGDLAELHGMLSPVLSAEGVYDYVVATKHKETLTPNLPLAFRIPSIDGYDGGVLPLRRYVDIKTLFPLTTANTADGRLREQLAAVPDSALLSWLNVRYVLMDRIRDVWVDGVYYDLGLTRRLASYETLALSEMPELRTTMVGIVSHLAGGRSLPDGAPVAEVAITTEAGEVYTATLRAGADTAEGKYVDASRAPAAHTQARRAKAWRDDPSAFDYITLLRLPKAARVRAIRLTGAGNSFTLRGLSVIDEEKTVSLPVVIDPTFKLSYLGDVKVYENRTALERAFLVHSAVTATDDSAALASLRGATVDPRRQALLTEGEWARVADGQLRAHLRSAASGPQASDRVVIEDYRPEYVAIATASEQPSLLVLTDSYYPGWRVAVDGRSAELLRANHVFRAVALPAGSHKVQFEFVPDSLRLGLALSLIALAAAVALSLAGKLVSDTIGRFVVKLFRKAAP